MSSILASIQELGLTNNQLALVGAGVGTVLLYSATRKPARRYPPGPPGKPVIGNMLDYPSGQEWVTFDKWQKQYGDIVYCDVAGTKIVVINSVEHIKGIFEERGSVSSERPSSYFANEMLGWKLSPIMHGASHEWFKPCRKMMYNAVGSRAALDGYVHMEEHEVHRWLLHAIDEPDRFYEHNRRLAGTIILRILYGYDVKPGNDDPYVKLIEQVNQDLNRAAVPGNFLVDMIPALRFVPSWVPGTGWKRELQRMQATLNDVLTKPINMVKEQMAAGTAQPSFVGAEMQRPDWNEKKEHEMLAWSAEALYTGGADTSVSIATSFVKCMVLFPEVQKKGQAELDAVFGGDQLPTWADRERLPYTNAVIKEVMRWAVVAPQGLPRCALEDFEYNGYFFEKGTIMVGNTWACTRNPDLYKNPEQFNPDRFLGPNPELDPRAFAFGFGRRICPGKQVAEVSLFLTVSNTFATLDVLNKIGADGKPIIPTVAYSGGAVVQPSRFECDIKPRNMKAETLIRACQDAPYGH